MTISAFIKQYKVTFFSGTIPTLFPHHLPSGIFALLFGFALQRSPEYIIGVTYCVMQTYIQVSRFFSLWYGRTYNFVSSDLLFRSVYFSVLIGFLFVSQDLIDIINSYFRRNSFCENCLLLASKIHHHKFFPIKINTLNWISPTYTRKENAWQKISVSIIMIILILLKKGWFSHVSVIETRRMSNWYDLALFTVTFTILGVTSWGLGVGGSWGLLGVSPSIGGWIVRPPVIQH